MTFIHNDAIILPRRWLVSILAIQHPLHQSLHRRNLHARINIRHNLLQPLQIKNIRKLLRRIHRHFCKSIAGLFAQYRSIDQKQNSSKPIRRQ